MFSILIKLKRRIKRLLKVQSGERQLPNTSMHSKTFKFLMLILFSVLVGVLYQGESLYDPLDMQKKGEIAREDILAPFEITVYKTERELREEKEDVELAIPFLIDYDSSVVRSVSKQINSLAILIDSLQLNIEYDSTLTESLSVQIISRKFPMLSQSAIESVMMDDSLALLFGHLKTVLENNIYEIGVLPDHYSLPQSRNSNILIRYDKSQRILNRSRLMPEADANLEMVEALNLLSAKDSIDVQYYHRMGKVFIQPNLHINMDDYNRQVAEQIKLISNVKEIVEQNDIVLSSGKRITEQQARVLREMVRVQQTQAAEDGWVGTFIPLLARMLLILSAFTSLYLFLYYFRQDVYRSNPKLLALFLVFALQLFLVNLAEYANIGFELSHYIYPISLLPIMVTILFDAEVGIISTFILAFLLGVLHRFDFSIAFLTIIIGTTACFTSRHVRRRSEFFRIMYSTAFAFAVFILLMENLKLTPNDEYLLDIGYGIINGILIPLLAIGMLPIFESIFSITTDITLLELSDLNHPLLKRLSLEAPGTYHHSIIVGTLTESAAKAIGANSLLARVGAYFHDIGKIEIPEYFVENQLGLKSKHEELTPSMSSIILSSHVKKGRLLGEEADIPDDVLSFIEEHHGTMVQSYFYNKAIEQGMDEDSANKFRYPGPKPQTRETGIAMLADAVEAASRTLDDPKPARIDALIQRIINDRFESGELDECPLTLKDLSKIKKAFSQILIGSFHHRIKYPSKEDVSR